MPLEIPAEDQQILDGGAAPTETQPQHEVTQATQATQQTQDDKQVPLAALHEARQIQKELKEQLRRRDEELGQFRSKAEKMEQTFQQFLAKQNEAPAPKYEEDPLGTLKWQNEQLNKQLEELNKGISKTDKEIQEQRMMSEFSQRVIAQENVFRKSATDYDNAVAYLKDVRLQDFQDMGFDVATAQQALQSEIYNFSMMAMQQGKSPAEVAYNMAKRYGYSGEKSPEKKLETLQKGQDASKALAGGKADVPVTLEALAQLDDDQLDQLIKDDKAWKKLGRG